MTTQNRARAHPHQAPVSLTAQRLNLQLGMYGAAVRVRPADLVDVPRLAPPDNRPDRFSDVLDMESATNWLMRELHRPSSSAHHHTVHVLGKPYHWRQDYTGQLKLAAGESPW